MRIKVLAVVALLTILLCLIPTGQAFAVDMSPTTGIVGTDVTVTGLGDGLTYSIFWDSTLIKQGTSGSTGYVTFTVPASYSGEHSVVVEQPTNSQVLSQTYTVLPNIAIDTITGGSGTNITVTGHGFALNEKNINVTYDGNSMKSSHYCRRIWHMDDSVHSTCVSEGQTLDRGLRRYNSNYRCDKEDFYC